MPFLPLNQQRQSTEGSILYKKSIANRNNAVRGLDRLLAVEKNYLSSEFVKKVPEGSTLSFDDTQISDNTACLLGGKKYVLYGNAG